MTFKSLNNFLKLSFLAILIFLIPDFSLASYCYLATGFSYSNSNGTYEEVGTQCSQPLYQNENGEYIQYSYPPGGCTDNSTYMDSVTPPVSGGHYNAGPGFLPSGSWNAGTQSGPGTTATTTCPGSGSTTTSTTFSEYGIWGAITTSTQALISDSGLPFWEIGVGLLLAFCFLFLLTIATARAVKWLMKH